MPVKEITEEDALVDQVLPFKWKPAGPGYVKVSAERAHRLMAMGERISPNPRAFPRGVLSDDAPIFTAPPAAYLSFKITRVNQSSVLISTNNYDLIDALSPDEIKAAIMEAMYKAGCFTYMLPRQISRTIARSVQMICGDVAQSKV